MDRRMMYQAQEIVSNVCASMSVEGFFVDDETRNACLEVAMGNKSASDMVNAILAGYERK